jgi:hypothetical protein
MPDLDSREQKSLPPSIRDLIVALMRAINTARLYASGHALLKEHSVQLHDRLRDAMGERNFLFIGCARDALFLDGTFYQVKDVHLQKFLDLFHSLGVSHLLLDEKITAEEIEYVLGLLAGARQGQGVEVSKALSRARNKHIGIGLLDYSIFSSLEAVTARLAATSEDEHIWRQLILHPAGAGAFSLNPEQIRQLLRLCEDMDELKKVLLQIDADAAPAQQGGQAGVLMGNFIQNLVTTLDRIVPEKRKQFALQVGAVIDSLEPRLKIQILGSVAPDASANQEENVIQEIIRAMPDAQVAQLLVDALREGGAESPWFLNLFQRALDKYSEPAALLTILHQGMYRQTQRGDPSALSHWQHLEQLAIRRQEKRELDEQYRKEIGALATSLNMQVPMVEDEEIDKLITTLSADSLLTAKAQLVIDLLSRHSPHREATLLTHLIQGLAQTFATLYAQKEYERIGDLLRWAFLALAGQPPNVPVREAIESTLSFEDIRELLDHLLESCSSFEPPDTASISAICQLYPTKAGSHLLETFVELDSDESPKAHWLLATLAGLGANLTAPLNRKLQHSQDKALIRLVRLAAMLRDQRLAHAVEKLLDHGDHEIRLQAITTLGQLKAGRSVTRLAEMVSKRSWLADKLTTRKGKAVQMAAVRALGEIGSDDARKVLERLVSEGPSDLQDLCRELLQA